VDTSTVQKSLVTLVGDSAPLLMDAWRSKQLEYSFRRGLMDRHVDFSVCTRQALIYCCQYYNIVLTEAEENRLVEVYRNLPAFPEVKSALTKLREKEIPFYAFSNGSAFSVKELLEKASVLDLFTGIVSTEEVKSFKPSPNVYQHFLESTNTRIEDTYLVSGNSFDILGAKSVGIRTIWVKRKTSQFFDPWGTLPDRVIVDLEELL